MKTSTIYCYLLLIIVIAISCGKDSGGGGNASNKIKSYTEDITQVGGRQVETYNVSYDGQGRITTVQSTTKKGHRMVYTYSAENSFTFDRFEDDTVTLHNIYFINSLSLIDSTWQVSRRDTGSFKFVYDADKRLIKQKEYINSFLLPPFVINTTTYQYDINGVLVKESDNGNYETSYSYDKDVKNTAQLEPPYFPFNEHLPSHTYTIRLNRTYETKHSYTLDDHNRIASERQERTDGKITIMTYTYE